MLKRYFSQHQTFALLMPCTQGSQVPALLSALQHAEQQSEVLSVRLQEEMELRADLERELEDTATAAQELWESMQTLCTGGSEAPESAAHSTRAHE